MSLVNLNSVALQVDFNAGFTIKAKRIFVIDILSLPYFRHSLKNYFCEWG